MFLDKNGILIAILIGVSIWLITRGAHFLYIRRNILLAIQEDIRSKQKECSEFYHLIFDLTEGYLKPGEPIEISPKFHPEKGPGIFESIRNELIFKAPELLYPVSAFYAALDEAYTLLESTLDQIRESRKSRNTLSEEKHIFFLAKLGRVAFLLKKLQSEDTEYLKGMGGAYEGRISSNEMLRLQKELKTNGLDKAATPPAEALLDLFDLTLISSKN